jgi:hypothetical protein
MGGDGGEEEKGRERKRADVGDGRRRRREGEREREEASETERAGRRRLGFCWAVLGHGDVARANVDAETR